MIFKHYGLVILLFLFIPFQIKAQNNTVVLEVYVDYDINASGIDRIQLINLLDGSLISIDVDGERYTLFNSMILYFDHSANAVMIIRPDGTTAPHPFIQLGAASRIDWVISEDERLIAWTLTYDNADGLTTVTTVSNPIGTDQNLILADGPRTDGARILPVTFTRENRSIILDSQPDGIGDISPYQQYASLVELSFVDGSITPLIGDPNCFCAASLRSGQLIRLSITSNLSGFNVNTYNLINDTENLILPIGLGNYTQGGNILISPDGRQAIYALSQIEIGSIEPSVQTIFVLVDLETFTQRQLSEPISFYAEAIRWTEDNTAVLITMRDSNGTWKIDLNSGDLTHIATSTFIGTIVI